VCIKLHYIYTYIQYIGHLQLMHLLLFQAALNKAKQELEAKRAALKEQNKVSADHHQIHVASLCSLLMFRWGVLESLHVHC